MAQFAPHYTTFDIINKIKYFSTILFWVIFGLALFDSLLPTFEAYITSNFKESILSLSNCLNILSIIIFFVLELFVEVVLNPIADDRRRDDFIDNSLGSRFSLRQSVGYYDNDEVAQGMYKVAVNMFENCFFTHYLVKRVTMNKIITPLIVIACVITFAYFGFNKQTTIAVLLLQVLFSATIIGNFIKHIVLLIKLNQIEKDWIALFNKPNFKTNPTAEEPTICRIWLNYETLHSRIPASIPKKFYDKYNPQLTAEWIDIKSDYNIS